MFSKVPSCAFSGFWTLTLKLTQHFDLIYNIGKSDWKILRNIMKTAQDSYTITIKHKKKKSMEVCILWQTYLTLRLGFLDLVVLRLDF